MNTALEAARTQMVNQQVRAWDVLDPAVLDTLAGVPREQFVPDRYQGLAFADTFRPLPCGQVMLTPQLEGRVLQALELRTSDRVLEVGTGSGFLAACLARLGGSITSLELHAELAAGARARLHAAGAVVDVVTADVFAWTPAGPYDAIAVTGSLATPWPRFAEWLAPGGRLFVVTGRAPVMEACLVRRAAGDELVTTPLFETVIPALERAPADRQFVF
jgi:protein-L-isoaspartate(D-aspartate) O-methyltransferase